MDSWAEGGGLRVDAGLCVSMRVRAEICGVEGVRGLCLLWGLVLAGFKSRCGLKGSGSCLAGFLSLVGYHAGVRWPLGLCPSGFKAWWVNGVGYLSIGFILLGFIMPGFHGQVSSACLVSSKLGEFG